MRFIVENVSVVEDVENPDFFLVSMIDEASAGEPSALGDELAERFGVEHVWIDVPNPV